MPSRYAKNRLPPAPPARRHPVHSPSARPRESSLERVRRLARTHQAEERPFDPERRGSWRGSSRDLVVNGSMEADLLHEVRAVLDTALSPDHNVNQLKKGDFLVAWHLDDETIVIGVGSMYTRPSRQEAKTIAADYADEMGWVPSSIEPSLVTQITKASGRERFQDLHHGHFVTIRKHQKEEPGHVHFSFVERDRDGEYWLCDYTMGSDYSDTGTVGRANYLALKEMCEELESEHGHFWVDAYGAHASFGILLDVETTPDEIVEVLEKLEDYPIISEDKLGEYEIELADEAWENWGKGEFRKELEKKFGGDADGVTDEDLFQCFHDAMEETNTYWEAEGSDMYVDMKRVVKGVDSPPEGFEEE